MAECPVADLRLRLFDERPTTNRAPSSYQAPQQRSQLQPSAMSGANSRRAAIFPLTGDFPHRPAPTLLAAARSAELSQHTSTAAVNWTFGPNAPAAQSIQVLKTVYGRRMERLQVRRNLRDCTSETRRARTGFSKLMATCEPGLRFHVPRSITSGLCSRRFS